MLRHSTAGRRRSFHSPAGRPRALPCSEAGGSFSYLGDRDALSLVAGIPRQRRSVRPEHGPLVTWKTSRKNWWPMVSSEEKKKRCLSPGSTTRFFRAILRYCDIAYRKKFRILNFFAIMCEQYCVTFHTIMRFPQCDSAHPFALDEHFLTSPRASHSHIIAKSHGKSRSRAWALGTWMYDSSMLTRYLICVVIALREALAPRESAIEISTNW